MSKKTRKHRTYRKKLSTKKRNNSTSKKYRKNMRSNALARGATSDNVSVNVNCCMCDKEIRREDGLIPVKCLTKYGTIRAHRICQECWFDKFAKEGVNHSCPGCVKDLPLNGPPISNQGVIDLTED